MMKRKTTKNWLKNKTMLRKDTTQQELEKIGHEDGNEYERE